MTRAEALAFNAGVLAVLDVARRSAAAIADTSQRRVYEDFAIAALTELAESGRALLIADETEQPILPPSDPQDAAP